MRNILLALAVSLSGAVSASAKLRVVATIPELVDIAKRVGGDEVTVDGLARGTEDIHQVVMRPSFVSKLNRADAVVYLGLTVEHSFLPGLLDVAANPRMRTDVVKECLGPGCIDCSEGISVLEKPENLSRAEGELHPQGNPHYNVGPDDGPIIARNVARGLSRIAPDKAAVFDKNLKAYLAELEPQIARWRAQAAPLKGVKAVSYHKDVAYLARFTGIDFIDTVELKPGVAPTPTHLAKLVQEMKAQGVTLIVREQHFEPKTCEWLAEQTGAKIAVIGIMANALPGTETFAKLSEANIKALLAAAGKNPT
ncbi:MAG TPA: metal ABC transporter substrate-binding protein [Elusimicrobiota bacterium]|jgi:zinc/manganese transport system substrate-binding protein|nr:metal ABC transporter substrate-binding protein [Elusimicrobiota bacterium]